MTVHPNGLPKIGARMFDGTIYAGISPETGGPMYVLPSDAPKRLTFHEANDYAAGLNTCGYADWKIPTKMELNILFNNRAAIGGFRTDRYLASTKHDGTWQRFVDGQIFGNGQPSGLTDDEPAFVRAIRRGL